MNLLLRKEIRLLLPAYVLAFMLAVVPIRVLSFVGSDNLAPVIFLLWFGVLMLALTSFGREFSLKTFPLLLTQPVTRSQMWWAKVTVLALAMATVFGAYLISAAFSNARIGHERWSAEIGGIVGLTVTFAVILSSALWTTLLLRQTAAAFWFALVIPIAICGIIGALDGTPRTVCIALGVYSAAGYGWAWRQFHRAQETAWTGGEVALPAWRISRASSEPAVRTYRPFATLLWKELKLQQTALAGMAALFLLHLAVVGLRKALMSGSETTFLSALLNFFGGIWLIVPLLTAGASVADERRLGTMEGQLCLPVARRVQFIIKLLFSLLLSGLLSALLLWLAEIFASAIGAPRHGLWNADSSDATAWLVGLIVIFMGISLVTFYASTLAGNILQAIAIAVGMGFLLFIISIFTFNPPNFPGFMLWEGPLFFLLGWPILLMVVLWLAFVNFRRLSETRRIWWLNVRVLTLALLGISLITAALFNRVWEFFVPLEPPHGPAHLTLSQPPTLDDRQFGISIVLPDGRWWQDPIIYEYSGRMLISPSSMLTSGGHWVGANGDHFLNGSNWVAVAGSYMENVGIQSDGTLWISETRRNPFNWEGKRVIPHPPAKMIRFGEDTNWKSVVRGIGDEDRLFLKTDGTFWRWGTNHPETNLAAIKPHQLGSDSDWSRLFSSNFGVFAWKNDGSCWKFDRARLSETRTRLDPELVAERWESFDNQEWRSIVGFSFRVGVRSDGTLWEVSGPTIFPWKKAIQLGNATNWVSVAANTRTLVALKTDGSLWQWTMPYNWHGEEWLSSQPPTRMGSHNDWVALGKSDQDQNIRTLAADGSLWHWDGWNFNEGLLRPSRKPSRLANIFGQ